MKLSLPLKIATIIVVAILLTSSVYVIFFTGEENNGDGDNGNNGEDVDNEPPSIDTITGDTAGKKGEKITISATFSDNINVTTATLHYRTASADEWSSASILSGRADISLTSKESVHYYITVDDDAGNGPVGDPSTDGSAYYTITILGDENGQEEFVHTVFIEEASYTSCAPCVKVASILDELYKSGEYNFYYVSLIQDKSDKAKKRIEEEYKVWGYPVVFVDGGYKVLAGGGIEKSEFVNAIRAAESRDAPEININITVKYNENTSELSTTIYAVSNETEKYTGRLRVYLTEIISRWNQANTEPYHYAFLDYIIDKKISIAGKGDITETDKRNITEFAVPDLEPEELMIVAVIFSSESVKADSWPAGDKYGEFDAYFADATSATLIVPGGNLPPSVGISLPETSTLHILGQPIWKFILRKNTILIGKMIIKANASDDSGIEKVEFYLDGDLKYTDEEAPYEYEIKKAGLLRPILPRKHTITVKAYDTEGKTDDASLEVRTRFF